MLGTFYLIQNTTFEIDESTPGLPFQYARDIPNESANGGPLTDILVDIKSSGAREPDGICPKSATSIAAHSLLDCSQKWVSSEAGLGV